MTKYADLHIHTNFSDGTFSPAEVIRYAKEAGLSCVAICDHDSVSAIAPAIEEAKKHSIEVIPGVELTVEMHGRELHMLGYFISWQEKWFMDIMEDIQRQRVVRMQKMIDNLKDAGIAITMDNVRSLAGKGSMSRLHLARAMLRARAIPSLGVAFSKYIGDGKPCYEKDIGFSPDEAVKVISKAGGVSVLAHPYTMGMDNFLPELIECGLRGLEAYHSDHPPRAIEKYKEIAEKHNLLITGGSDCHGMAKERVLMGRVMLPYEYVEKLREAANKL